MDYVVSELEGRTADTVRGRCPPSSSSSTGHRLLTAAIRCLFNITSEMPGGEEGDSAGVAARNRPQEGDRADQKTSAGLLYIWWCNLARPRPRERLNHYHLIFAWRGLRLRNYSLQSAELISSQRLPGARPDHSAIFLLACILIKPLPQPPPHGQRPLCPDSLPTGRRRSDRE